MPVAQMTLSSAVASIRASTAHDNDQQVTDPQIQTQLDKAYRRFRRWLSTFLPEFYQKTSTPVQIVGQSGSTLAKPDDFERVIRVERNWPAGSWYPLTTRPMLDASMGLPIDVSGTYRLTYSARPIDGYSTLSVPEGCEDIILEEVCAWVRQRHEEDPSFHIGRMAALKRECQRDLAFRYGSHPRSGLMADDPYCLNTISFFEEGDHFVIY